VPVEPLLALLVPAALPLLLPTLVPLDPEVTFGQAQLPLTVSQVSEARVQTLGSMPQGLALLHWWVPRSQ
jgi:hypothetical protein